MSLSKALKSTITAKLISFCKNSTLHGFYYFYKSTSKCVHFTWILIILASIALCCFLSHMIWEKYAIDPTLTVVESTHYSVSEIPFPAITICDTNIVYRPSTGDISKRLLLRGYNNSQVEEFYESFSGIRQKDYTPEPYVKKMHSLLHDLGFPYKTLLDMVKRPCDKLIIECVWRSRTRNCSEMFRPVFTIVGYCCQFDIPYFKEQVGASTNYIAGINAAEALDMMVEANEIPAGNTTEEYAMLYVFDKKDRMTLLDSAITVTPAAYFDVNVYVWAISSSSYVNQLPLRSRKCILETDAAVGASFYQGCMSQLILRRVVNHCRCLPFEYLADELQVDNFAVCTWDRLICVYQAIESMKVEIRHIVSESECYQRCDYVQYETEVEFVKFHRHLKDLNATQSRISVHFSDSTCMKYRREVLYTWDQMLANLGGIFGLCLGGSVISIIELVWFLFDLIFGLATAIPKKGVTPKKNEVYTVSQNEWTQKKTIKKKPAVKFKFVH